jgi:hypothetical protein
VGERGCLHCEISQCVSERSGQAPCCVCATYLPVAQRQHAGGY